MKIHLHLRIWASGVLLGFLHAIDIAPAAPAVASRPNIVFLFSDDQRADTLRAWGNRQIQTPALDRLVHEGFSFTRTYCMGSTQPAVCVPSRAMLMTGRGLFRATIPGRGEIPSNLPLWPALLREAGYRTIGIGKWHNDRASFQRCFEEGGPVFFGGMSDQWKVPVFDFDPSGRYPRTRQRTGEVFSTELFTEAALRFLGQQTSAQPFLLYVAYTVPHDPRTAPAEFLQRYSPEQLRLPRNFLPQHPFDNGELEVRDEKLLPRPLESRAIQRELAAYYAMITHLDHQVGRILKALDQSGLRDNTIVVFAADNGLALGSHGLLGKQNLYEHSVRVPLVIRGPGVPSGKRSEALCYLLDLFPTLLELSARDVPPQIDGKSLLPIVRGKTNQVRDAVFGAYRHCQRMIADSRWKLITYPAIGREQLFDLRQDPAEIEDLSRMPKHAATLAELRGRLESLQGEFHDPLARRELWQGQATPTLDPGSAAVSAARDQGRGGLTGVSPASHSDPLVPAGTWTGLAR